MDLHKERLRSLFFGIILGLFGPKINEILAYIKKLLYLCSRKGLDKYE